MADTLDYPLFDADNHYYEALDAFTRHVPANLQGRCVQWADIEGRKYHVVGGRVSHAVRNATFNPISKPGSLYDYLRGNPDGKNPLELLRDHEPIPDYYLEPTARAKKMDEQNIEAMWLFPTLGVLYEELLLPDVEAVKATFTAFNRWLADDWGIAHDGRIFSAPYITLVDCGWAVQELEWALERGARIVCMRPAAAFTASGPRSPGDPCFDAFWARVQEAGITVVIHAGDSGYTSHGYAHAGFSAAFGDGGGYGRPSIKGWNIERAAMDFLATLIFDRLFERFPGVRLASVENGSEFLPYLFRKLESSGRNMSHYYQQDPVETFKRNVWINPFWEDDVEEVVALMGADHVIFGSDWPHIEGLPEPAQYWNDVQPFDADARRLILRENALALTELQPAG